MHELALSQSIVALVLERARAERLRTVTRVAVVSGPVGDHGIAVMAARADLEFDTELLSDSAPVIGLVSDLLDAVPGTHVLRDRECELILEVVSYGAEPGEVTSARTALRVAAIDFNHVHPLSGGLERWRQAGFPVEPLGRVSPINDKPTPRS